MIAIDIKFTGMQAARAAINGARVNAPRVIDRVIHKHAVELAGDMRRGVRNQAPGGKALTPLAKSTILMKKSSKALIHHGDLVRSINATDVGESFSSNSSAWFVGVHRTARGRKKRIFFDDDLVNIAEIHEFGTRPYTIRVTNKMRRFFMAMFIAGRMKAPLPPSKTVIQHPGVPERPFVRPTFDHWQKSGGPKKLSKEVARELGFGSAFGG
jgi:hypothetical protein